MTDNTKLWTTPTLVPDHEMGAGARSGQGPFWELAGDILNRLEALPAGQALRYGFPDEEAASRYAKRVGHIMRNTQGKGKISTRCRAEDGQAFLYVRRGPNYGGG